RAQPAQGLRAWRIEQGRHGTTHANLRKSNMLDFIGMVITATAMALFIATLTNFMDASRTARITLAAVIGVWIGLAAAAAGAGWIKIAQPVPVVGLFVVVPLLVAALATAWPAARQAMLS